MPQQGVSLRTAATKVWLATAFTGAIILTTSTAQAAVGYQSGGVVGEDPAETPAPAPLPPPVALPSPTGGEVCGIIGSTDIIFANGFESGAPTLQFLRTTKAVTGGGSPTVTITYPTSGLTLPGNDTVVTGTFTGPADTGLAVNGVLAYVSGNAFLVPSVPLATGSNTLQATATTLPGLTAQSSVSVTKGGSTPPVQLSSNTITGYLPLTTTFVPVIHGVTVSQLKIDYNGDGTDDFVTTNPLASLKYTYTTAGLYTARLTIIDSTTVPAPTTYVAYKRTIAVDVAETRETLCSVYSYLRTNLAAGDVASAVLAFDEDVRANYQALFGSISAKNLPVAAARLGTIANGILNSDYAELKVIKTFQGTTASFPMTYARDEFGVWRIDGM